MSTTVVKCNSCNIVISEVLAFIQNKLDVMDQESLIRICSTAFSSLEIEEAKNLLHESIPSKKRLKTRRRDGKVQRDLDDIIVVFHEVDPDIVPIFVAKDLYKLPPVSFDHVDATRLLKDILVLQNELKQMKECLATKDQVAALKTEVDNIQRASVVNNFDCNINKKRGACLMDSFTMDSGPDGLPHITDFEQSQLEQDILYFETELADKLTPNLKVPSDPQKNSSPVIEPERQIPPPLPSPPRTPLPHTADTVKTLAVVVNKDELSKKTWTEVVKKRKPKRQNTDFNPIRSRGCEDGNLKAAENRVPVFLTNIHRDWSAKDIVDFVHKKTGDSVSVVKLSIKNEAKYSAFKVFVPRQSLWLFINPNFWPAGIVFRRFINFKRGETPK